MSSTRRKPTPPVAQAAPTTPSPAPSSRPMSEADWSRVEAAFGTIDFDVDPSKLRPKLA